MQILRAFRFNPLARAQRLTVAVNAETPTGFSRSRATCFEKKNHRKDE
jgi:hypothetical protein